MLCFRVLFCVADGLSALICFADEAGVADVLSVIIGSEMLKIVPGRVSTEVCSSQLSTRI